MEPGKKYAVHYMSKIESLMVFSGSAYFGEPVRHPDNNSLLLKGHGEVSISSTPESQNISEPHAYIQIFKKKPKWVWENMEQIQKRTSSYQTSTSDTLEAYDPELRVRVLCSRDFDSNDTCIR
jgi:hypothetical protein